jgi:hypothetical protein
LWREHHNCFIDTWDSSCRVMQALCGFFWVRKIMSWQWTVSLSWCVHISNNKNSTKTTISVFFVQLCHVFQQECRFREATEFMESCSPSWTACTSFLYVVFHTICACIDNNSKVMLMVS